jgi:hypothetical protein
MGQNKGFKTEKVLKILCMKMLRNKLTIFVVCLLYCFSFIKADEDEERLFEDLFVNSKYNAKVKPTVNRSEPIQVSISGDMTAIHALDYENILASAFGYFELSWYDYRLAWNTSEYKGIQKINAPSEDVWIPSVKLSRSVSESIVNENSWNSVFQVEIYSNGLVKWTQEQLLTTNCVYYLGLSLVTTFNCTFSFRIWLHTNNEVTLMILHDSKADTDKTSDIVQEQDVFSDDLVTTTGNYSRVNFTIIITYYDLSECTLAVSISIVSLCMSVIMAICFIMNIKDRQLIAFEILLVLCVMLFVVVDQDKLNYLLLIWVSLTIISNLIGTIALMVITHICNKQKEENEENWVKALDKKVGFVYLGFNLIVSILEFIAASSINNSQIQYR